MKKTGYSLLFVSIFLLMVGCSLKPNQADVSKEVSKPSEIKERPTIEQIIQSSNFMLIQASTDRFPQSQGVYDIKNNQVTVVKQYTPKKNSNITNEDAIDLNQPIEANPVEVDIEQTFPGLSYDTDPFKVYSLVFTHVSFELTNTQLTILADNKLKKVFTFTDENKNSVVDNNGVVYKISYGS